MNDKPKNFKEWYVKEWVNYTGTVTPKTMLKVAFKAGGDQANSEMCDRIQGYIRVIKEKDALLADLAKPSEWISVETPPVYVLVFSVARKGWCIFKEDIKGVTMEYWTGPFSEQCVAESEIKRLAERTP